MKLDPTGRSIGEGLLKLGIAVLLSLIAWWLVSSRTTGLEQALQPKTPPQQAAPATAHRIPGAVQDFEKALDAMKSTSDLLTNWSITLLGGTIAIAIMAKGAKIRDRSWGLVLLPPTWVFLGASLLDGSDFKRSLTFQLAKGQYTFSTLNLHLFLQMDFFKWSLGALTLLGVWYLFFRFALLEEKTKGADE